MLLKTQMFTMKLLRDSFSNGPHLGSCPLAQKVTRALNLGAIDKYFATGIKNDPVSPSIMNKIP